MDGADAEDFFLSREIPNVSSKTPSLAALQLGTPNELHSPGWGRQTSYFQPKLRAESPPPESILEQAKPRERFTRGRTLSDPSRGDSHDRALKSAPWSIQPAEQGNGGIRNAVNAATRAGKLKDRLWVSLLQTVIE